MSIKDIIEVETQLGNQLVEICKIEESNNTNGLKPIVRLVQKGIK